MTRCRDLVLPKSFRIEDYPAATANLDRLAVVSNSRRFKSDRYARLICEINLIDLTSHGAVQRLRTVRHADSTGDLGTWSPDGQHFAVVINRIVDLVPEQRLEVFNATARTSQNSFVSDNYVTAIAWTPDSRELLMIDNVGIYSLDVSSGAKKVLFYPRERNPQGIGVSKDGRHVLVSGLGEPPSIYPLKVRNVDDTEDLLTIARSILMAT
jgi:hypothetical protein